MKNNLKQLQAERYNLEVITQNTRSNDGLFKRYADDKQYSLWVEYLDNIIQAIDKDISKLPIGYKFKGTFYFRKPYTMPYEVVEVKGSAFMRHDLISWSLESDLVDLSSYGYFRNIYKDKECRNLLKKEDATPIFKYTSELSGENDATRI